MEIFRAPLGQFVQIKAVSLNSVSSIWRRVVDLRHDITWSLCRAESKVHVLRRRIICDGDDSQLQRLLEHIKRILGNQNVKLMSKITDWWYEKKGLWSSWMYFPMHKAVCWSRCEDSPAVHGRTLSDSALYNYWGNDLSRQVLIKPNLSGHYHHGRPLFIQPEY